MNGNEEIHDLLQRALEDVSRPVGASTGELVARGRRQQRRRRVLAAAGVLGVAAVAAVMFASVGASREGAPGPAAASPAPSASRTAGVTPTDRVRSLLPQDAGAVAKVLTFTETVGGKTVPERRTALNGRYTLGRSAGVGYLEVSVLDPAHDGMRDPSAADMLHPLCPGGWYSGCTDQKLTDGSTLLTRVVAAHSGTGLAYEALLVHPDGRSVDLIASSGNPAYGALLPAPPLTRAQLATLVQAPGWFADPMG